MDAPRRPATTKVKSPADSDRARVLCAVAPEFYAEQKRTLEPTYEVERIAQPPLPPTPGARLTKTFKGETVSCSLDRER